MRVDICYLENKVSVGGYRHAFGGMERDQGVIFLLSAGDSAFAHPRASPCAVPSR